MAMLERNKNMEKGRVKWFDEKKGYGLIEADSGEDVFAHIKCFEDTSYKYIDQGDEVSFDIEQGKKGPLAAHVRKL
jgi:CspA family cold shock protein